MFPRKHTRAGHSSASHKVLVQYIRTEMKNIRAKVDRAKVRLSALALRGRTRITKSGTADAGPYPAGKNLKHAFTVLSREDGDHSPFIDSPDDDVLESQEKHDTSNDKDGGDILTDGSAQRITDFELGGALGRGTFGNVYLARHRSTDYICAIKILLKARNTMGEEERFIRRELEVHQNLAHPNILRFLSWFHDDAQIYLVLEYAAGGNLYHRLKKQRNGRFTEDQVATYIEQVASALTYMHDKNIMHRDIKPENILIGLHGEVKLADFGYSIHTASGLRSTICGTLDYIPPEIAKMTGSTRSTDPNTTSKYTRTVDQWSLGILAYELFVGRPPLTMKSTKATEKRIADFTGKIKFPGHVSQGAEDFVKALLRVEGRERMGLDEVLEHEWLRRHYGEH